MFYNKKKEKRKTDLSFSGKLDVALGLRVNQYKLFVHLSFP